MKETKELLEFSLNEMERLTERMIEAERFIAELNWFERLFCSRKITKFLNSRNEHKNI